MLAKAVEEFFAWESKNMRLEVLKKAMTSEVKSAKNKLLQELWNIGIFVLSQGAIEEYYPNDITGPDKPSRAQMYCNKVTTREKIIEKCPNIVCDENGTCRPEFEIIFGKNFSRIIRNNYVLSRENLDIL